MRPLHAVGVTAFAIVGVVTYGCASKYVVELQDAAADPPTPTQDANSVRRCTATAPFGVPESLTELATKAGEDSATLTQDELTLYFNRDGNLLFATRAALGDRFGNVRAAGLEGGGTDGNPALTSDGKRLFFSTESRGDSGTSEIYVAPVVGASALLGPPSPVRGILPSTVDPYPVNDASALYYAANRGGASSDLWLATGIGGSTVLERKLEISDLSGGDGQPILSHDELSLFFTSTRAGGRGRFDIFVATRTQTTDEFAGVTWLGPIVNSVDDDLPAWVSNDGCVLYLVSDRAGGAGGRDIYRTTRGR
jgi:Tol biopolymer transport system component